jgi:hypothetical protein
MRGRGERLLDSEGIPLAGASGREQPECHHDQGTANKHAILRFDEVGRWRLVQR